MRLWDFINTPCTVKKTYQGHINKDYSVGGCFGMLRSSMRKLAAVPAPGDEIENENDFQEEQWVEGDSVAFVASASEDGAIVLWDVKTKEILQRVEAAHQGVCFWVDVHGETGSMVSCGQDGRIVVFRHRLPETAAVQREHGVNGHAVEKAEENGVGGYPEEESEARLEDEEGNGGGDGDETMPEAETEPEPVQTNGHHEDPEGVGNGEETPAPKDEADVTMDG